MNLLIFGATGMVGQGVLLECLRARDVEKVVTVGRKSVTVVNPKLETIVPDDLFDLSDVETRLTGLDACFFCLGISSGGISEAEYTKLTYELTLSAAATLVRLNPGMTFAYVSGAGTDSREAGRSMWARVKGRTENDLQRLPFAGVYLFRPGVIQPLNGIKSQTASYRVFYSLLGPVLPTIRRLLPDYVLTTEIMGKAMLAAARAGKGRHVLETRDINALAVG